MKHWFENHDLVTERSAQQIDLTGVVRGVRRAGPHRRRDGARLPAAHQPRDPRRMTAATGRLSPVSEQLPGESEVLERASGENFSVASLLLGRATRRHLLAIYGFARLVDQLGDDVAGDRLVKLDAFQRDLERVFDGDARPAAASAARPDGSGVRPAARALSRLIEANRRDQELVAYQTFDELVEYCDAVGGSRRRARPARLRRGDTRPDRALEPRLHRAAAGRALAGRGRGLSQRARLPAGRGSRALRGLRRDLGAARTGRPLRQLLAFEVARAQELLEARRRPRRPCARPGADRDRRLRRRRPRCPRRDRRRRLRRAPGRRRGPIGRDGLSPRSAPTGGAR